MKQTSFTLLLSVLLSMVGLHAYASDIEVDGIYYNFNADSKTAEVTFKGDKYNSYNSEYTGAVVIPSEVMYGGAKYSVTSIGSYAFRSCTGLTSVTIPNSVTSIGSSAFYGCSGLTSVIIPSSVKSIGGGAFSKCSGLTSMKVESGYYTRYDSRNDCNAIIETASNKLIAGCKNTVIPNSVTSIGDDAFYGCSGLTSITIPNSVTSIKTAAFSRCTGLTSVTIGSGVTWIGPSAFFNCSKLTSVTVFNPTPGDFALSAFSYKTNATLYVPKGSKDAYQAADCWKEFKDIKETSLPN